VRILSSDDDSDADDEQNDGESHLEGIDDDAIDDVAGMSSGAGGNSLSSDSEGRVTSSQRSSARRR
jgi:hypothetical protein